MWAHPGGNIAKALDAAASGHRFLQQARNAILIPIRFLRIGPYQSNANLKIGFSVSWRNGASCWKMCRRGGKSTVRSQTRIEKIRARSEAVYAWLPGTEPTKRGSFYGYGILFEGMIKRGTNDNLGSLPRAAGNHARRTA